MKSNPWKGLRPYEFDDAGAFYGRNTEILQLTSLIEYNHTVTLYGKSGIGKSSLLKAGVFPWLKLNGYNCHYLRLNELDIKNSSFIDEIQVLVNSYDGPVVIVLDQFEEVLRSNLAETELLLEHIALNKFSRSEGCELHFVISIREDDFFLLEDSIDKYSLNALKSNRFRLKELSLEAARDIIGLPSGDLFDEKEIDTISDRIISAVKNLCNDEISTVFLSFICSRIYFTFQKDRISASDIDEFLNEKKDFLSLFFEELKQKLNDDVAWQFLENNLVANDGRRTVAKSVDFNQIFQDKMGLLLEGDYSILRAVNFRGNECVELVHDILALYLLRTKKERIEREAILKKQKQIRIVSALSAVFFIFALSLGISLYKMNQSEDNFLLNESRYLAYAADDILEGNENITLPLRLMLYALPDNLKNPSRPHSIEAESILRLADFKFGISPINYVIDFRNLRDVEISFDDKYILMANDYRVGLYNSYTGKEIRSISFDKKLLHAKFTHSSDNVLLVFDDFTVREINMIESVKDVSSVSLPKFANDDIGFAKFNNDGSIVAYSSASSQDSICFYNIITNKVISKLPYSLIFKHSRSTSYYSPKSHVFSQNSANFLHTYHTGYARIYNIGSSSDITPENLLQADDIKYAAFASDYFLVTLHKNNSIKFWDLKKGACVHELLHDFRVADICINSTGDKLIMNSDVHDKGRIIDLNTFSDVTNQTPSNKGASHFFQKGYFCPDSSLLLISKLRTYISSPRFKFIESNVNYLRNKVLTHFSNNCKFVLSKEDNSVYCFNLNNLKQCFGNTNIENCVIEDKHYSYSSIKQAAYSEDHSSLYLMTSEGCLVEYDVNSGKMLYEEIISNNSSGIYKFSPDGKFLAIADYRYNETGVQVELFDLKTKQFVSQISTGQRSVDKLVFIPDGEHLICQTYSNRAYVYNYVNNEMKSDQPLKIYDIAFCNESKLAVTLNSRTEFSIWNLTDKSKKLSVSLPEEVRHISISKNGKYVVTCSDYKVRVWDVVSGNELTDKMLEVKVFVNNVLFSDDSDYLLTYTRKGIKIFDFNSMNEIYSGVLDNCYYYEFLAATNNILLFDSARNLRIYNINPFEELVAKYKNDKSGDWTLSDSEIDHYKLNSKYQ